MSGHIGDYKSNSHWYSPFQITASAPERLIHQGKSYFQYGGATWTTNYTLPAVTDAGSGHHRWFRLRSRFGDSRWNCEGIALVTQEYAGFLGQIYAQWNTLSLNASTRLVSIVNGNGGTTNNMYLELLVWEIFGATYPMVQNYIGDS
tara:strand:- start:89 stop:529 length:441 start_codon:yes stop_codon:yes gene_type:complete